MQSREAPEGAHGPGSVPVEVLRPEDGAKIHVRSLSGQFGGIFIHWQKGRSHYCHPTECYPACKRQRREWRGYTPVEQWCGKRKAWFPGVLEVTEYLHVELAELWSQWQVWELYRPERLGNKRFPTVPKLLRQDDGEGYPKPFAIMPILKRLLGPNIRDLDEKNPMPARTYLKASQAPPPIEPEKVMTPEEMRAFRERVGLAFPSKNGAKK